MLYFRAWENAKNPENTWNHTLGRSKIMTICLLFFVTVFMTGCAKSNDTMEKIKDLECTVMTEENIPEELKELVDQKKEDAFRMTFEDRGFLYVCIGYGRQETGGYSIAMKELYETANAIYVKTNLIGPKQEEKNNKMESFPYIVIKTEQIDKPVVFE